MGWDECVFEYRESDGIDAIRKKISRNPDWNCTKFHQGVLCRNESEASKYLGEHCGHAPNAVRFYKLKEDVTLNSPLLQQLNDEWDSLQAKYDRLTNYWYYNPKETPEIVCPCCDETIETANINYGNRCYKCGGDVRPKEVFKELKDIKERWATVKEKYMDEYDRLWDECEDKEIWWYGRYIYNIDSECYDYDYDYDDEEEDDDDC